MFSRSKQLEEVEAAVVGVNSDSEETVTNISSASPKSPVNGSAEPRSKRTIRRPAYWLEMRGMKNSVNKSSEKNGIYHCWSKAKLIFSLVLQWEINFAHERHAAI